MRIVSVKEVKDHLCRYLKYAEKGDVIITKNGKPAAVLHYLGDDDLEDYLLEHDPRFKQKIAQRWKSFLKSGQGKSTRGK